MGQPRQEPILDFVRCLQGHAEVRELEETVAYWVCRKLQEFPGTGFLFFFFLGGLQAFCVFHSLLLVCKLHFFGLSGSSNWFLPYQGGVFRCAYANNQHELGDELRCNPRETSFFRDLAKGITSVLLSVGALGCVK